MPEITKELSQQLKEYEAIKLEMISLDERAKELKEIIFPLMDPQEKIQLTEGKIYLKSMPKWEYSPHVVMLDEELKTAKKQEQANGNAQMIENYVLEYRRDKTVTDESTA